MNAFEQIGVAAWLAKQCSYMTIHEPTPIQSQCIPAILSGKHVVGGAATGSGKTAAFALPLLQILSEDMYGVFALVLTPSRELAYQIMDQFIAFGAPLHVRVMLAIGGIRHDEQVVALKARPHIVLATPGRLLFLLRMFPEEAGKAFLKMRFLVLDEADRLTEGDIAADVREVLRLLPPTPRRQVLLFSATLSPRLTALSPPSEAPTATEERSQPPETGETVENSWLPSLGMTDMSQVAVFTDDTSGTVQISRGAMGNVSGHCNGDSAVVSADDSSPNPTPSFPFCLPAGLKQTYVFIPNLVKLPNLVAALRARGSEQTTIVFANSCMRVELVRLTLQLLGFPVCSLSSILSQKNRLDNLALFKLGIARILIATDIASRGLDIPHVGMVVHYDVPKHASTYVHRVGRTARAGREGLSVALVTEYDVDLVQRIERKTGEKMTLWKEKMLRESNIMKILDEVSSAKVQAKLQASETFGNRVSTLKEHAAGKRAAREQLSEGRGRCKRQRSSSETQDSNTPYHVSKRTPPIRTDSELAPTRSPTAQRPSSKKKKRV